MTELFDLSGYSWILIGDDDADFVVRVHLIPAGIQQGLVVDVVQRDVHYTSPPQAEVGSMAGTMTTNA
ncbi:hypothetical protein [Mycobacterium uberis]|uniref:hypothetical protein n=1 Tax=Mycobacterium uberis TaxID=2162698 RepID=UPI000E302D0D|nr:hypothetical protein [Mycobacterium uberis]